MVPVVLSILVVVLMSGAVLWVVAGDRSKPTGDPATLGTRAPVTADGPLPAPAPPAPRRPATSRRRPLAIATPAPLERVATAGAPPVERRVSSAPSGPPMPRHRTRSGLLLVLLTVVVGVLVAAVVAVVVAALAFALRAAVTS